MNRMLKPLSFLAGVAMVTLSAGGRAGVRAERAVQAPGADAAHRSGRAERLQVAQHRPGPRRPLHRRVRREGAPRTRRTSAPSAAACGRRPTAARTGRRSPTARSTAARSAPSPSPSRTPTSSTSAWASRASAATSCRATASTSRPTPARRGRTSASPTPTPSRRSASIRPTPTSSSSPTSAATASRATSAALFKSADGGKTWKKVLFRDDKTGAVDVEFDRKNPDVMYAALWEAYRVEYQMSSGGPGSGLFKSTDGGETWKEITRNPGLPAGHRSARSASRSPAPTRTASTRSSRTRTAACSAPTTPARRGSW